MENPGGQGGYVFFFFQMYSEQHYKTVRQKSQLFFFTNKRGHIPNQVDSGQLQDQGGTVVGAILNIREWKKSKRIVSEMQRSQKKKL